MKKALKLFGIIALVAIIVFSVFACGGGDDDDDGGGDGSGGGNNNGGNNNGGNGDGKTVLSIVLTGYPTKTIYIVGDKLDTSGLVVTASYSDGTTQDVTTYTTNFDSSTTGTKTVTVSYGGKTATRTFTVTVYAKGESGTFNSIYDFEVWLTALPNNIAAAPHTAKLNISSFEGGSLTAGSVGYIIKANYNKYLNLDLSGSSITNLGDDYILGAFWDCSNLTGVIIPNSVTFIRNGAFGNCTSLTSVNIPDGVTRFGSAAFHYCVSLASITIPDGVTSIGKEAFRGCSSLTSVILPTKITSIEDGIFQSCSSLTSITIPANVTSIGHFAFSGCTGLTSVTFQGTINAGDFSDAYLSPFYSPFDGNLRAKYFDSNGGIGTYVRAPGGSAWTKL